ncbi:MAG: hypothetical protein ACJA1A_002902 [Saprospiraceae bacterium]|jgi:hypothetical protein
MRILLFVLMVSSFTMCKSKDKILIGEKIHYVVLLKKGATIKMLKKAINHEILDAKLSSKSLNQWTISFNQDKKKSKHIKRDLLNVDFVISVFTPDELENMNSKSNKKAKVSPIKERQKQ